MLKAELNILKTFMSTSAYRDYRDEARATRDEAMQDVLSVPPCTVSDFVSREQNIGAGRVATIFLAWFEDQVDTLESLISEREAPPLDQPTT